MNMHLTIAGALFSNNYMYDNFVNSIPVPSIVFRLPSYTNMHTPLF